MGESQLSASAIHEVAELAVAAAEAAIVTVDGVEYSLRPLHDPRKPKPEAETLKFASLASLVTFATRPDLWNEKDLFLHVEGPEMVALHGPLRGAFQQREEYGRAVAEIPQMAWGQFQTSEMFIIALLTRFVQTPAVEAVLKVVGNLEQGTQVNVTDDGCTQNVQTRQGIVRTRQDVERVVYLQPYSTFPEVDQTERPFLLRLRQGSEGALPTCALFEADGGLWRVRTRQTIAKYLEDLLVEAGKTDLDVLS